jgi:hypothetical protein
MIPKIIHQTWKTDKLPDIFDYILKYNTSINSNYNFKLWTDDNSGHNIDNFIKINYPKLYIVYSNIDLGVQKSDLARIAILHHFGGIYIDLDILLLKSLDDLLDYNSEKLYFGFEPKEQTLELFNRDDYICNAFFACNPNNILLEKMINSAIDIYEKFGNIIYNKFNVFGSDIFKFIIHHQNNIDSDLYCIIDSKILYPINDIKLELDCCNNDISLIKNGNYNDTCFMVHYWIHSNFEGKKLINDFKYNVDNTIHYNIYSFFKTLYPNNKYILKNKDYIEFYNNS